MTTTTIHREMYRSFWDKFSAKADMSSMLLNQDADQLEALDRSDIVSFLPDFTGMDVVDVGAGIGRFTSIFAEKAKHVVSSDFIESFIIKNQERNANFPNISYKTSDALNLKLEANSADLVFTNWLLMYLGDGEVVDFLCEALRWLRPGGYLHVRESCTESSSGRLAKTSLHGDSQNPTHYRYASVYLKLLEQFCWKDEEGRAWKFQVQWAKSVPTYIERALNWRQVHWLLIKVPATNEAIKPLRSMVAAIGQYKVVQDHTDHLLSTRPTWTSAVVVDALAKLDLAEAPVLTFSPRVVSPFVFIDAHSISKALDVNVWAVETNAFFYRNRLNACMAYKDPRVQYGWNSSLATAVDHLAKYSCQFAAFVGTELFLANDETTLASLENVLVPRGHVLSLEPANSAQEFNDSINEMLPKNMSIVSVTNVSEYCREQKQAFNSPNQPCWLLVHARCH